MIRGLLMILAVLSMVGSPAMAMKAVHGQAREVSAASTHHHHHHAVDEGHDDVDVVTSDVKNDATDHAHHCPFHHNDGKCCDGLCCLSNCIMASYDARLGADADFRIAEVRVPGGDLRSDATVPCLPDRPPIAI